MMQYPDLNKVKAFILGNEDSVNFDSLYTKNIDDTAQTYKEKWNPLMNDSINFDDP